MRESCGILFADAKKVLLNFDDSIEKKKNLTGINFQAVFFLGDTQN